MRLFWFFLLNSAVVFGSAYGAEQPPCEVKGIGAFAWTLGKYTIQEKINDDHKGKIVELECTNVKEVGFKNSKYLKAAVLDNVVSISVTEDFKNFEETETETEIVEDFYIKCLSEEITTVPSDFWNEDELAERDELEEIEDKEYHLAMTQLLNDLNTFEPKFTQEEYIFQYYQDLPATTLTDAQRVSAEDKDMSTETSSNSISFKIEENEYFSIHFYRADDFNKRLIHSEVRSKKYIKAPFEETYTITVTDSGKPEAKFSTAKLTIQLFSEETLVFTKPVYRAELDGKNVNLIDGPIEIVGGHDLKTEYNITSEDDIANAFKITETSQSIKLELDWSLDPELVESKDYLYLTVTANKVGRVGHFAVMIKTNGDQTQTTTEAPITTPSTGGIVRDLEAFEAWILAGTVLVWISFTLLSIALAMVIFSFKMYWQKKYNL